MYKKILYPALAIFTAWFFAEGIPVDTFESASTFLSVLGSIVFCVLVVMSLFQFAFKKPEAPSENAQAEGCFIMLIILVSLFGYGAFLIYHGIARTETEFKEHGVYTIGTITDGSSYEGRKYSESIVTVHFENKKGEKRVANVEITTSQFDKFYRDQQIPIVYSERYQTLVKVLDSNDAVNQYTSKKVRDVTLKDLEHIFELQNQIQVTEYLNSVNPEWIHRYSYQDSSDAYMNEMKEMGIKVTKNEIAYMLPPDARLSTFGTAALENGYEKIEGDKNDIQAQLTQQQMYIKQGYILFVRYKHLPAENSRSRSNSNKIEMQVPHSVGIVTLIKQ